MKTNEINSEDESNRDDVQPTSSPSKSSAPSNPVASSNSTTNDQPKSPQPASGGRNRRSRDERVSHLTEQLKRARELARDESKRREAFLNDRLGHALLELGNTKLIQQVFENVAEEDRVRVREMLATRNIQVA